MSEFVFSVGSAVCDLADATGLVSVSCYDPEAMTVLGTLSLFLLMLTAGMWMLMRG